MYPYRFHTQLNLSTSHLNNHLLHPKNSYS
nr:MAG TPA: hypothetical protein [Caudoviricetes sp.]